MEVSLLLDCVMVACDRMRCSQPWRQGSRRWARRAPADSTAQSIRALCCGVSSCTLLSPCRPFTVAARSLSSVQLSATFPRCSLTCLPLRRCVRCPLTTPSIHPGVHPGSPSFLQLPAAIPTNSSPSLPPCPLPHPRRPPSTRWARWLPTSLPATTTSPPPSGQPPSARWVGWEGGGGRCWERARVAMVPATIGSLGGGVGGGGLVW
jgi:hypothetical protein